VLDLVLSRSNCHIDSRILLIFEIKLDGLQRYESGGDCFTRFQVMRFDRDKPTLMAPAEGLQKFIPFGLWKSFESASVLPPLSRVGDLA
jgi:hypothetical protein